MVLSDAVSKGSIAFPNAADELWNRDYLMVRSHQLLAPADDRELRTRRLTVRTSGPEAFEEEWDKVDADDLTPEAGPEDQGRPTPPAEATPPAPDSRPAGIARWSFGLGIPKLFGYR
jgi:hypothetical protein